MWKGESFFSFFLLIYLQIQMVFFFFFTYHQNKILKKEKESKDTLECENEINGNTKLKHAIYVIA